MFDFFKSRRRAGLRQTPLAPAARAIVKSNVPYAAAARRGRRQGARGAGRSLPRGEIVRRVRRARDHRRDQGDDRRAGVPPAPSSRDRHVSGRRRDPRLSAARTARPPAASEGGVVIEGEQARLGRVVDARRRGAGVGPREVRRRAARRRAERGAPRVRAPARRRGRLDGRRARSRRPREIHSWAHVLGDEFGELSKRLHAGRGSDIDAYGATNPAEFFAVVTEMFFEKPRALKRRHPELYEELARLLPAGPRRTLIESAKNCAVGQKRPYPTVTAEQF